jgi:hypothetical protein
MRFLPTFLGAKVRKLLEEHGIPLFFLSIFAFASSIEALKSPFCFWPDSSV